MISHSPNQRDGLYAIDMSREHSNIHNSRLRTDIHTLPLYNAHAKISKLPNHNELNYHKACVASLIKMNDYKEEVNKPIPFFKDRVALPENNNEKTVQMLTLNFHAHVDADWGEYKEDRKPTSGWMIAINGTLIIWRTQKQSMIYIGLNNCVKQLSWMHNPIREMSTKENGLENEIEFDVTTVKKNSTVAAALAMNEQVSSRNKTIDLNYRLVSYGILCDLVCLTKILDLPTSMHLSKFIRLSGKRHD